MTSSNQWYPGIRNHNLFHIPHFAAPNYYFLTRQHISESDNENRKKNRFCLHRIHGKLMNKPYRTECHPIKLSFCQMLVRCAFCFAVFLCLFSINANIHWNIIRGTLTSIRKGLGQKVGSLPCTCFTKVMPYASPCRSGGFSPSTENFKYPALAEWKWIFFFTSRPCTNACDDAFSSLFR